MQSETQVVIGILISLSVVIAYGWYRRRRKLLGISVFGSYATLMSTEILHNYPDLDWVAWVGIAIITAYYIAAAIVIS